MASPFSIFRKNQKLMMAVLCIMAMFGFVIGDAIISGGGSRGGRGDEKKDGVAATTKYFDIHETMLERAVFDRSVVRQFLMKAHVRLFRRDAERELRQQLQGEQLRAMGGEEGLARRVEMQTMFMLPQIQQHLDLLVGTMEEQSIVESLIFAEQARKLGIQVSDKRVLDFINARTGNKLTPEELTSIYDEIGGGDRGGRLTTKQLYDAFRSEMLAGDMRRWFIFGPTSATTPLDRWHYYLRKNCIATAEVLAVDARSMLGQVAEPSEEEVTALFDKYKYFLPTPGSPEPGFKLPQQAAFQYLTISESAYFDPDKLTSEEVAKYYEENKGRYAYTPESFEPREPSRVTPDLDFAEPTPTPAPAANSPISASASTPTASSSSTAAGPAPSAAATPSAAASPTAKKDGSCDPATVEGTAVELAEEFGGPSDCQPAAGDKPADGASKPTSSATASASSSASPSSSAPAAAKPAATAAASAATASPSGTTAAAVSPAVAASPSGTVPAPIAVPQAPPQLPTDDVLLPLDIKSGKTPQFDPLWKVEKKVRSEMARSKAREKVQEVLKAVKDDLTEASLKRFDTEGDAPVYTAEQWTALAVKHGIIGHTTPLIDEFEARQKSEEPGFFHATVRGERVGIVAFATAGIYTLVDAEVIPETADFSREEPGETIHYLYWKTKHVNARVPELKEQATRDAVVTAFKMRGARELARKKAEELAAQGRAAGRPLSQTFGENDVRRTGTFSWFQPDLSGDFRQQMQQPELKLTDRINGVEDPGSEFFRTAFGLQESEIGTALNNPQTICYVIRLIQMAPPPTQLEAQFLLDHYQNYERYGRRDVQFEQGPEANEALIAEAELKWLREPKDRGGR